MYLILRETTHFSEDGWKTMCDEDVDSDWLLYKTEPDKAEEIAETYTDTEKEETEGPEMCPDCRERVAARTALLVR